MMNNNRLICSIMLSVSFLLLTSCASPTKIKELSSEVHDLNEKIDQISNDVDNILRPEIEKTKNEAIRANQRIDNQATNYRK